ncbi:MAG: leucyl/phenylalanyl-tRNA--protein transferase [Sediminibacterium sp.]|nr:leucyl/phenylalanyl-tRNA--protein transferase [Sediminibacterium sp.]
MPLHILSESNWFPPVSDAMEDGLLAIGGDVQPERLLQAYQNGIFPWYNEDLPLWWSPNPRFVLFPEELKVSKSMQQLCKRPPFEFTCNQAFQQVLEGCRNIPRPGQDGTWLNEDLMQSLIQMHSLGWAHSAEVWQDNQLVGGLYGIRLGKLFCGESMFSRVNNASKYAFIQYVQLLQKDEVKLIDCQVFSNHLASLGARMISRDAFMQFLPGNSQPL